MKQNNKTRSCISLLIVLAVAAVIQLFNGSFAAFISGGNLKGVAVAGDYYFTSNILQAIPTEADAENIAYSLAYSSGSGASETVVVRNFNTDNIPNTFDIGYTVKYKLSAADPTHTYTINDVEITSTEFVSVSGQTLAGNTKTQNPYAFSITSNSNTPQSDETFADIIIVAVPTSPDYMTGTILGAKLTVSEAENFSMNGSFKFDSSDNIADHSGFIFEIIPSGYATGRSFTVIWNSDRIELSSNSRYYADSDVDPSAFTADGFKWSTADSQDGGVNYKTLTVTADSITNFEDIINLVFYRSAGFDMVNDTLSTVSSYVEFTLIP